MAENYESPNDARRRKLDDARAAVEARGERVTNESVRAQWHADNGGGAPITVALASGLNAREAATTKRKLDAAIHTARAIASIGANANHVLAIGEDSGYMPDALPALRQIERDSVSAQESIESTLPLAARRGLWFDIVRGIGFAIVAFCLILAGLLWK